MLCFLFTSEPLTLCNLFLAQPSKCSDSCFRMSLWLNQNNCFISCRWAVWCCLCEVSGFSVHAFQFCSKKAYWRNSLCMPGASSVRTDFLQTHMATPWSALSLPPLGRRYAKDWAQGQGYASLVFLVNNTSSFKTIQLNWTILIVRRFCHISAYLTQISRKHISMIFLSFFFFFPHDF